MKEVTYSKLKEEFYDKENKYALITYNQSNFDKEYNEISRTYLISSDNRCFQGGKIANSLYGSCLDGTDVCVRLDNYNWKIEKIVILETEEEIEKYKNMIGSMI